MIRFIKALILGLAVAVLSAPPVLASQMVALNMRATGTVKPALAETLTPVLMQELSRRPGLSLVSQDDVRALLEHEASQQSLGCDEASCMTEIAGSLGAELLLSSTVGRVGRKWLVNLNLIEVEKAKVFRRVTGEQMGGEEAAADAVVNAVHNLFRDGLPKELQGPASLSRLGFKAAVLGFVKTARDAEADPKPARKRIILDLVHTELDYDVEPKLREIDLTSRRQIAGIDDEVLLSRNPADFDRLLRARSQWIATRKDIERVKEIRTRARERGVVPSARPLRFEDPEPLEWPPAADIRAYKKAAPAARKVVAQALEAYRKRAKKRFVSLWVKDKSRDAERKFENQFKSDQRYGYTYKLAPLFALPPWLLDDCVSRQQKDEMLVIVAQLRDGKAYDDERFYLKREGKAWRIRSW